MSGKVDRPTRGQVSQERLDERPEDKIVELLVRQGRGETEATDLLERRVHRKEDGEEYEHRQTATDRIDAPLLIELHLLLLEPGPIVPVLLLDVVHRRSELLHRAR